MGVNILAGRPGKLQGGGRGDGNFAASTFSTDSVGHSPGWGLWKRPVGSLAGLTAGEDFVFCSASFCLCPEAPTCPKPTAAPSTVPHTHFTEPQKLIVTGSVKRWKQKEKADG